MTLCKHEVWTSTIRAVIAVSLLAASACDRQQPTAGSADPDEVVSPEAPVAGAGAAAGEGEASEADDPGSADVPAVAAKPLPRPAEAGTCPDDGDPALGIMVSPRRPVAGETVRVVAATLEDEAPLALRLADGQGHEIAVTLEHRPGVPAAVIARPELPAETDELQIVVGRDGVGLACAKVAVSKGASKGRPRPASDEGVWPLERRWSAAEEALFSAWVRETFHADRGDDLAWTAMHEVTSDPTRNLLHDHFGWSEDDADTAQGLFLRPDCADAPYFLRAYFAWKRQLPFGFRQCSRGSGGVAPRCGDLHGIVGRPENPADTRKPGELGVVQRFFRRTLAWGVHTGNGRTAFGDDATDFYPVELTRRGIRPGTIYADPYGHIFVMTELMQAGPGDPGVLYAIDGQPDGSITRKRFWEGNFLWNPDPALGGSGFKAFRPLDATKADGTWSLRAATDADLAGREGYGDVSAAQAKLDAPEFYDHMDGLITPGVRDPLKAQEEAIVALLEAAKVRVTSVDNAEAHIGKGGGTIAMPDGYQIFETTGAWENFSTPARDLRILIALDVATGFADKVARNPVAWGAKEDPASAAELRAKLEAAREKALDDPSRTFEYTRTDGSSQTLTLRDLIARASDLEMAYNPNDCPEVRWGAPRGSAEAKTCRRRASAEQQRKMQAYRPWFHERRRPARGDAGPPAGPVIDGARRRVDTGSP
jgi:hypothetical protein